MNIQVFRQLHLREQATPLGLERLSIQLTISAPLFILSHPNQRISAYKLSSLIRYGFYLVQGSEWRSRHFATAL